MSRSSPMYARGIFAGVVVMLVVAVISTPDSPSEWALMLGIPLLCGIVTVILIRSWSKGRT